MRRPKRSETKTRIAHALAGLTICLEGSERFAEAHAAGSVMMALGLLLMLFARFHARLHASAVARHLDSAAFLLEATVMAIISFLYFERGKHLLPWCYAGIAVAYLVLTVRRKWTGQKVAAVH